MALLALEAKKLSNNQLVAGIIEEIIYKDELFARLPFTSVNGKAYVYNRENTIATADFLTVDDIITSGESTFTEVTANLKVLIGDVDVDKFLQSTMSDTNNQKAVQIALKAKGLGIKFKQTLIKGSSVANPKEFDGANSTVPNQTKIAATQSQQDLSSVDKILAGLASQK